MTLRIPRGYGVQRPYYQEICEGVRPTPQALPLEAWEDLPAVAVDERAYDPIVIMPGTAVGIGTSSNWDGKVIPASRGTYSFGAYTNQDQWGLPSSYSTTVTDAPEPIGIVYQPVYSFKLQSQYTNYQRSYIVPVVTDYVIQIPAVWSGEFYIEPGDMVMVSSGGTYEASPSDWNTAIPGRYEKFDPTVSGAIENVPYIIGRCLNVTTIATGGTSGAYLYNDINNVSVSQAVKREFGGLDKVNTVPGLGVAGTATKGIPGWLLGARADSNGDYKALTILVRL